MNHEGKVGLASLSPQAYGFFCGFSEDQPDTGFATLCQVWRAQAQLRAPQRPPEQLPKPGVARSSRAGGARKSLRIKAIEK